MPCLWSVWSTADTTKNAKKKKQLVVVFVAIPAAVRFVCSATVRCVRTLFFFDFNLFIFVVMKLWRNGMEIGRMDPKSHMEKSTMEIKWRNWMERIKWREIKVEKSNGEIDRLARACV